MFAIADPVSWHWLILPSIVAAIGVVVIAPRAGANGAVTSHATRVLALLPFSEEGASVRFRVSQFLPALSAAGFDVDFHPLFDTALFRLLYRPGHVPEKAAALLPRTLRSRQGAAAIDYDMALIHREAYPIGPPLIERWLAKRVPIVYDFDDAVYLPNTSDANQMIGFLKRPGKIAEIVGVSTEVIAGNPHLGDYARRYSAHVNVDSRPAWTRRLGASRRNAPRAARR